MGLGSKIAEYGIGHAVKIGHATQVKPGRETAGMDGGGAVRERNGLVHGGTIMDRLTPS